VLLVCLLACLPPLARAQDRPTLRWGGDAEGGAPFVEADPADPTRVVGFDVEVAALIAAGLDRSPLFVQVGFTSLDPAAARGDFDIGLSGIEDSPARRARLAVTIPYYEFREILTVRADDRERYRSLSDLRGRRVATLGATLAYDILVKAQAEQGVIPITYEDDVHPYSDLALGRVDAVVLDYVLAERGVRRCATAVSKRSSASGACGTRTSRVSTRASLPAAARSSCRPRRPRRLTRGRPRAGTFPHFCALRSSPS
jgi:polar amino acid transport system substrate-binding protein